MVVLDEENMTLYKAPKERYEKQNILSKKIVTPINMPLDLFISRWKMVQLIAWLLGLDDPSIKPYFISNMKSE